MNTDQRDEAPASNDDPTPPAAASRPKPRGMAVLLLCALVGFGLSGFLWIKLRESQGRVQRISWELSSKEAELRRVQESNDDLASRLSASQESARTTAAALRASNTERDELRSELVQATAERDSLRWDLRSTVSERDTLKWSLSATQSELDDCVQALAQAVASAQRRGDQLDEIASAIRIGMIGLTDIPSEQFVFSVGMDLEDEYRKVVTKYNNLIDRFNAAVDRSNDLGEIINKVIRVLRS